MCLDQRFERRRADLNNQLQQLAKRLNHPPGFVEAVFDAALNMKPVAATGENITYEQKEYFLPRLDGMCFVIGAINDEWTTEKLLLPRPNPLRELLRRLLPRVLSIMRLSGRH